MQRTVEMSSANVYAAIEDLIHRMKLSDLDETVTSIHYEGNDRFLVSLEKEQESG